VFPDGSANAIILESTCTDETACCCDDSILASTWEAQCIRPASASCWQPGFFLSLRPARYSSVLSPSIGDNGTQSRDSSPHATTLILLIFPTLSLCDVDFLCPRVCAKQTSKHASNFLSCVGALQFELYAVVRISDAASHASDQALWSTFD
jgi:hypothetical protein